MRISDWSSDVCSSDLLVPLAHWFRALNPAAATHGGILARCAATARALLAESRGTGVLHGDIHHDNVLDFGPRGWLAIDPKRLVGERGRTEEHTSELQSLMRISYAVSCLKKKKKDDKHTQQQTTTKRTKTRT